MSTFIVADDHPLFREALIHAIRNCVDEARIVEADSLDTLQSVVESHPDADLLFLDLNMPGVSGFSALAYIRNNHESLPTVIVSAMEDSAVIRRAIQHGASGFIPKSSPIATLEHGIRAVLDGEVWVPAGIDLRNGGLDSEEARIAAALSSLTPHQFRVMMMLGEGLLNKQIAFQLGVSEATIKAHVTAILRKMGVNNRTKAVLAVERLRINAPAFLEQESVGDLAAQDSVD
ncbi:MAG: response regulator transcription factor [Gammaproteobacteria bacterium]|nr:response regulator transcription factor [Gammaproteobacteria bacterium]MBT8104835.1 response regulator transcription factor [Gammaproteobacteria bacterium]NNK24849.1 response regulator transcription factor [Woeseiaceae bacterium]